MTDDLRGFDHPAIAMRQLMAWRVSKQRARLAQAAQARDHAHAAWQEAQQQLQAIADAMRTRQTGLALGALHGWHLQKLVGQLSATATAQTQAQATQQAYRHVHADCLSAQVRLMGVEQVHDVALEAFVAAQRQQQAARQDADMVGRTVWQTTEPEAGP